VADALGYPRSHWSFTLPVLVAALRAGLGAARRVNPLEAWLASVGERRWDAVVAAGLGDSPATFSIPESLGARGARGRVARHLGCECREEFHR
jgi:hypothetical protein